MLRKLLFPLILGLGGIAVLLWLGLWQVDRLAWKQGVLAGIENRIAAAPGAIPDGATKDADNYRAVRLDGVLSGQNLHVLVSGTAAGTGYRVIARAETDTGAILVDLGLLPLENKDAALMTGPVEIIGNLIWPDDLNSSTPAPDPAKNIWFARDLPPMAQALDTAPLMVVVRSMQPGHPGITPLPINTANIKNDHLEYAITWFLLAAVWAAMSGYLIFRTLRQKDA